MNGVVPAKAGTHSHRIRFDEDWSLPASRHTTPWEYGSWPSPGRRRSLTRRRNA